MPAYDQTVTVSVPWGVFVDIPGLLPPTLTHSVTGQLTGMPSTAMAIPVPFPSAAIFICTPGAVPDRNFNLSVQWFDAAGAAISANFIFAISSGVTSPQTIAMPAQISGSVYWQVSWQMRTSPGTTIPITTELKGFDIAGPTTHGRAYGQIVG